VFVTEIFRMQPNTRNHRHPAFEVEIKHEGRLKSLYEKNTYKLR